MKTNAPTQIMFLVALILGILALLGHFASIPLITANQYWCAIAAWAVLTFGCLFKGA